MTTTERELLRSISSQIDELLSEPDEWVDPREAEHGDPVGLRPVPHNATAVTTNLPRHLDPEAVQIGGDLKNVYFYIPELNTDLPDVTMCELVEACQ